MGINPVKKEGSGAVPNLVTTRYRARHRDGASRQQSSDLAPGSVSMRRDVCVSGFSIRTHGYIYDTTVIYGDELTY